MTTEMELAALYDSWNKEVVTIEKQINRLQRQLNETNSRYVAAITEAKKEQDENPHNPQQV